MSLYFLDDRFFDELFLEPFLDPFFPPFFDGTLAPSSRASESPIAIACFLLVTFFPDRPLFNVPCFRSCIAFSTFLLAFFPYRAICDYLLSELCLAIEVHYIHLFRDRDAISSPMLSSSYAKFFKRWGLCNTRVSCVGGLCC